MATVGSGSGSGWSSARTGDGSGWSSAGTGVGGVKRSCPCEGDWSLGEPPELVPGMVVG